MLKSAEQRWHRRRPLDLESRSFEHRPLKNLAGLEDREQLVLPQPSEHRLLKDSKALGDLERLVLP